MILLQKITPAQEHFVVVNQRRRRTLHKELTFGETGVVNSFTLFLFMYFNPNLLHNLQCITDYLSESLQEFCSYGHLAMPSRRHSWILPRSNHFLKALRSAAKVICFQWWIRWQGKSRSKWQHSFKAQLLPQEAGDQMQSACLVNLSSREGFVLCLYNSSLLFL